MEFDILLPFLIFIIIIISIVTHQRLEKKISVLFEDKKLNTRDTLLMITSMGVMISIIAFAPKQAIQILFLSAYLYMIFFFTYIITKRWYFAIFPPIIFIAFYFLFWEIYIFNFFAITFALIITIYLGTLLTWKTTLIFTILLMLMDIIQVFGTRFMVVAAGKMLELKLPVAIMLSTYPINAGISLGLGDIFLSGLLSIQTTIKHGLKKGIIVAGTISLAMFLFEIILFNFIFEGYFPATVIVVLGWIFGMGIIYLTKNIKE